MERNDQRALRVVWLLIAALAIGAVAIAVVALVNDAGDGDSQDAVEVRSAESGEGKADESADKPAGDEKPAASKPKPSGGGNDSAGATEPAKNPDAPVSSPASAGGSVGTGTGSSVTTFACKTDVGVDAPGCGTVYDANGLRVEANCDGSGLAALASVPHAVMTAQTSDASGESFGSITDSSVDRGFDLASADNPASSGTVTFTPPDSSKVIVLDFSATYAPGTPQGDCVFVGKVTEL